MHIIRLVLICIFTGVLIYFAAYRQTQSIDRTITDQSNKEQAPEKVLPLPQVKYSRQNKNTDEKIQNEQPEVKEKKFMFANAGVFHSWLGDLVEKATSEEDPSEEAIMNLFCTKIGQSECRGESIHNPEKRLNIYRFGEKGAKVLMKIIREGKLFPEDDGYYMCSAIGIAGNSKYRNFVDPLEIYQIIKDNEKEKWAFARNLPSFLRANMEHSKKEAIIKEVSSLLFEEPQDVRWSVRHCIAGSLGDIGDQAALPYLEKALWSTKDESLKEAIQEAKTKIYIMNMPREAKFKKLRDIALDIDPLKDKQWAVMKLADEGYKEAIPVIRSILDKEAPYSYLVYSMYKLGGELTEEEKKRLAWLDLDY